MDIEESLDLGVRGLASQLQAWVGGVQHVKDRND